MEREDLESAYHRFAAKYADGMPIRGIEELEAALMAAGVTGRVDDEWFCSLNQGWVYGETAEPFTDARFNRRYWQLIEGVA